MRLLLQARDAVCSKTLTRILKTVHEIPKTTFQTILSCDIKMLDSHLFSGEVEGILQCLQRIKTTRSET